MRNIFNISKCGMDEKKNTERFDEIEPFVFEDSDGNRRM